MEFFFVGNAEGGRCGLRGNWMRFYILLLQFFLSCSLLSACKDNLTCNKVMQPVFIFFNMQHSILSELLMKQLLKAGMPWSSGVLACQTNARSFANLAFFKIMCRNEEA